MANGCSMSDTPSDDYARGVKDGRLALAKDIIAFLSDFENDPRELAAALVKEILGAQGSNP